MRVFIIALGLVGLYTLAAPSGQSVATNLIAGALCMAVAMAITGKGSKTISQSAGRTTSLTPYLFLLSGVAALAWGIHLYIAGIAVTACNRNPPGSQSAQFSAQIK